MIRQKRRKKGETNISSVLTDKAFAAHQFSPLDISGLAFWAETGLRSSIVTSGGLVDQWSDLSGNARHATNTGVNRPTLDTDGSILFNGTSQWLEIADSVDLRPQNAMTVFCIFKSSSATAIRAVMGKWAGVAGAATNDSPTGDEWILAGNYTGGANRGSFIISEISTSAAREGLSPSDNTNGSYNILEGLWDGTNVTAITNGTAGTPVACAGGKSTGTSKVNIGRYARTDAVNPGYLSCNVIACLIYTVALTSSQRTQVRNYLKAKYNTP